MLIKINEKEIINYIDFAYEIVLDQSKSSYPIYTDRIKTKKDFKKHSLKCASHQDYTTLLYCEEEIVKGLIQFFVIKEDKYLQLCGFNMKENTKQALIEFSDYLDQNYADCDYYFGFPDQNKEALVYLEKNGFTCIETAYNDTFIFKDYTPIQDNPNILKINQTNFADFKQLHQVGSTVYWNSERILSSLEKWNLFVLYEKQPIGAIYERNGEIYGMDYLNNQYSESTYTVLVQVVLNNLKKRNYEHMTFFNDEVSQMAALKLGFVSVGQYVLYIKKANN